MSKNSSMSNEEKKSNVLKLIFNTLFAAPIALLKMIGDEIHRKSLNKKYLLENMRVAMNRGAILKMSYFLMLSMLQVVSLLLFFKSLDSSRLMRALSKSLEKLSISPLMDVIPTQYIWILGVLILIGIVSYYLEYHSPFSSRVRFWTHVKDALMEDEKNWYYSGRMAYLCLNNSIAENFLEEKARWRKAGFSPSVNFRKIDGTNHVIYITAAKKDSNSTFIYDRYKEWESLVFEPKNKGKWFLGEFVEKADFLFKGMNENNSTAFIGTTGSGKTEAMKCHFTYNLLKHKESHMVIIDMKQTGDWDTFAPFTDYGRVIKDADEAVTAVNYLGDILLRRKKYMESKGYKNIAAWGEAEGIVVPVCLLVIDEFPALTGKLAYDRYSEKDGHPANTLKIIMTQGRSFGLWLSIGSQFGGADAIPSQVNKNIKVHVCLRTGSAGESQLWINADNAFFLGKDKYREDGEEDPQQGYAYVDGLNSFVRFMYMHDWYITHELLKHQVPRMKGTTVKIPKKAGLSPNVQEKLKSSGGDKRKLSEFDRKLIEAHEQALKIFSVSFEKEIYDPLKLYQDRKKGGVAKYATDETLATKEPLGLLPEVGENAEAYYARSYKDVTGKDLGGEASKDNSMGAGGGRRGARGGMDGMPSFGGGGGGAGGSPSDNKPSFSLPKMSPLDQAVLDNVSIPSTLGRPKSEMKAHEDEMKELEKVLGIKKDEGKSKDSKEESFKDNDGKSGKESTLTSSPRNKPLKDEKKDKNEASLEEAISLKKEEDELTKLKNKRIAAFKKT